MARIGKVLVVFDGDGAVIGCRYATWTAAAAEAERFRRRSGGVRREVHYGTIAGYRDWPTAGNKAVQLAFPQMKELL